VGHHKRAATQPRGPVRAPTGRQSGLPASLRMLTDTPHRFLIRA